MVTMDDLRQAWEEAANNAVHKNPRWALIRQRSVEYCVPLADDGAPILIRCRCCHSITTVALGTEDSMPDANLNLRMHAPSPCGYCRNSVMLPGWTVAGVREAHAKGVKVGL
jgi:hypothetical protein